MDEEAHALRNINLALKAGIIGIDEAFIARRAVKEGDSRQIRDLFERRKGLDGKFRPGS